MFWWIALGVLAGLVIGAGAVYLYIASAFFALRR